MGKKSLEYALYGLTIAYSFVIAGTSMGDTSYVAGYLIQRIGFYFAEVVFLLIGLIRCNRLFSKYDYEYFQKTEAIFEAAECCFVTIAIITVISVAAMVPIFIFLPKNVFEHGAANGLLVSLLIVGLVFLFYLLVMKRFDMVKKKRGEIKNPLGEKPEDFFAFIHSPDEKDKEPTDEEMPDASELLDDFVPDEEDFRRHLQRISAANPSPQPQQLWECPFCGSLNTPDSRSCSFCGADHNE